MILIYQNFIILTNLTKIQKIGDVNAFWHMLLITSSIRVSTFWLSCNLEANNTAAHNRANKISHILVLRMYKLTYFLSIFDII